MPDDGHIYIRRYAWALDGFLFLQRFHFAHNLAVSLLIRSVIACSLWGVQFFAASTMTIKSFTCMCSLYIHIIYIHIYISFWMEWESLLIPVFCLRRYSILKCVLFPLSGAHSRNIRYILEMSTSFIRLKWRGYCRLFEMLDNKMRFFSSCRQAEWMAYDKCLYWSSCHSNWHTIQTNALLLEFCIFMGNGGRRI